MSGIHTIMSNALNTRFQLTDDFQFTFSNNVVQGNTVESELSFQDILDICCISTDTPQLSSDVEPVLMGGSYRLSIKKFQSFTFSCVFRDIEGSKLKNYFTKIWMLQQSSYFDEIKSSIQLSVNQKTVFSSENCLISSVSQSQYDNGNTQASEFTVEFQSPYYSSTDIKDYGKPGVTGR